MSEKKEVNPGDYKLLDILNASPYHPKTCMDGWLTEERFQELLIVYNSYFELKSDIDKQLHVKSTTLPFVRFITGYSGIGKTTFIHWFCNQHKDNIKYAFLDFSDTEDYVHEKKGDRKDYEYQIENRLLPLLSLLYEKNPESLITLLKHLNKGAMKFFTYFAEGFSRNLRETKINDKIDEILLSEFLNSRRYSELLLLILLFYNKFEDQFLSCTNGNVGVDPKNLKDNNLLLIIDNLDSLKMEIYSKDILRNFVNIYEKYLKIIDADPVFFDKYKRIDFFYFVRDTIHSVINPHEAGYADISTIRFAPNINETKQYINRIDFAKKYKIEVDEKTELLLKYIFQDSAFIKSYLPLFNYNNKKIASNIHKIAFENNIFIDAIESLINTKTKSSTVGARGIFYFLFLRYMKEKDFFNDALFFDEGYLIEDDDGKKKNVHINPIRIIMTILLNLGKYHLDIDTRQDYMVKVGLYDVYQEYRGIFENLSDKEQRFFNIIARLFLFYENNWCHLLTFTDKEVLDLYSFYEEVKLLQEYEQNKNVEIKKSLNKIKINLNASGYIYLKDIARHYEYFSIRANNKPLFVSLSIINKGGNYTYEFLENIETTFGYAELCIKSLIDFLTIDRNRNFEESNCCYRLFNKEDSIEDDFDSIASFYDTNRKNGRLFVNRIIDHHTEYIDNLRIYLTNNNSKLEEYSKKMGKQINEIVIEINIKILDIIEKYVSYYFLSSSNQYERKIQEIQRNNIDNIRSLIGKNKLSEIKELTINDGRKEYSRSHS